MSQFAGQTGELRFTAVNSSGRLDFIQFSNQPIPEPSTVGLFAIGVLLLGWRSRGLLTVPRPEQRIKTQSATS
jgi:hypothetical protein